MSLLQALLIKNAKVYMAGRNAKKLDEAIKELRETTGKEGQPLVLDLANLLSVKQGANDFLRSVSFSIPQKATGLMIHSKENRLDILFNNA